MRNQQDEIYDADHPLLAEKGLRHGKMIDNVGSEKEDGQHYRNHHEKTMLMRISLFDSPDTQDQENSRKCIERRMDRRQKTEINFCINLYPAHHKDQNHHDHTDENRCDVQLTRQGFISGNHNFMGYDALFDNPP